MSYEKVDLSGKKITGMYNCGTLAAEGNNSFFNDAAKCAKNLSRKKDKNGNSPVVRKFMDNMRNR